ncbi:GNAT family N-acetyltransferase [Cronobacter sakazakii]|uniref:GNAT family N-acetyltransferase n=1 Tax=Cronobacter sakazakii TaxID=28141 RepID=UPI001587F8C0|nr:GNAT family protein [Cronobacter sakazakii]EKK5218762.1 GNAT family N-acetyltransferase [Cronobacter sakazakii]ELY3795240.1 GNAT family N-acetyltransferase [Cronobacter sakazakii]ELY3827043.1 GNAT family N-acetyltransferase [Cronobacter sakazakii]ELY4143844.1 GNAT family N-acetyltransferase [Cronobacter sakazakii]NUW63849.1 GNAT family N-acetyltransferase [Cronobacter sakazakii]
MHPDTSFNDALLTFSSTRLDYRPLTPDDWPFFLSLQRDDTVMRFVADPRSDAQRMQDFASRLPPWTPASTRWLCLLISEKHSGQPVGVTGFVMRGEGIAEVGFLLASAFQGRGYGYESLRAICRLAFEDCGLRRLVATVTGGNIASKKTLEKAGFLQEGTLRESYFIGGRWHDDWLFGLLARDSSPES